MYISPAKTPPPTIIPTAAAILSLSLITLGNDSGAKIGGEPSSIKPYITNLANSTVQSPSKYEAKTSISPIDDKGAALIYPYLYENSAGYRNWDVISSYRWIDTSNSSYLADDRLLQVHEAEMSAPVFAALSRLLTLPHDWDGYGGRPASESAVRSAINLYAFFPKGIIAPRVQFAGDGEISFGWDQIGTYFEIGIDPGGSVSYFGKKISDGQRFSGNLELPLVNLPSNIQRFLKENFPASFV